MEIKKMILSKLEQLSKKNVNENMLLAELKIDSLDLAELIYEAENKYNIIFSDEELNNLKSVKDVINLAEKTFNNQNNK
ncbi:phosphopantetheine-binding protein [Mycoplasma sp. 744]|uniref:phosphopantetheine-binding protein n=1 Tax=Mycoplasma sp. 744 TaxID=3108531 RepID=UPI002B1D24BC|nr:phosphopantetheine-binding protein [Mycoplasma sp. 744]MEA4115643.1 phosphopantetheine-binding protein [Mycoplasma sp. 744]